MDEDEEYDVLQKVLIIGDTSVGKVKVFESSGTRIKMQVWDTAGQERFRTITHTYFRGASGIFLVYDVANAESFRNVSTWMESVEAFADEVVVRVLVGNKADTEDSDRQVSFKEGEDLAKGYGVSFCETSAKTGANVEKMFHLMADQIMAMHSKEEDKAATSRVQVESEPPPEQKKCAC